MKAETSVLESIVKSGAGEGWSFLWLLMDIILSITFFFKKKKQQKEPVQIVFYTVQVESQNRVTTFLGEMGDLD